MNPITANSPEGRKLTELIATIAKCGSPEQQVDGIMSLTETNKVNIQFIIHMLDSDASDVARGELETYVAMISEALDNGR